MKTLQTVSNLLHRLTSTSNVTYKIEYTAHEHRTYAIFSLSMPTIMLNLLKSSVVIYQHSQTH